MIDRFAYVCREAQLLVNFHLKRFAKAKAHEFREMEQEMPDHVMGNCMEVTLPCLLNGYPPEWVTAEAYVLS